MMVGLRITICKVSHLQKAKKQLAKVLDEPGYIIAKIEIVSIKYFWNHVIERIHTPYFKLPSSS